MGIQKCMCFELRLGIIVYAILGLVAGCFSAVKHLYLVIVIEDHEMAAETSFMLGADFLNIAIGVCLLYGAYKERRMFLLPYLIIGCIGLALVTIVCIIFMFYAPILIISLVVIGIMWYIWSRVLAFFQLLDPDNPNYVRESTTTATPDNTAFVESTPPPYYDDKFAEAV